MEKSKIINLNTFSKGENEICLEDESPQSDPFIARFEEIREYNDKNQLIKVSDSVGDSVILEYDENGNNTKKIYSDGNVITMTYNENNKMTCFIDSRGYKQELIYDKNNNLIKNTIFRDVRVFGDSVEITGGYDNE